MKVRISITLSRDVLEAIDRHGRRIVSRSEFLEAAARGLWARMMRSEADRRDLWIIDRHAVALNAEALDVLRYQAPS